MWSSNSYFAVCVLQYLVNSDSTAGGQQNCNYLWYNNEEYTHQKRL